MKYEIYCQVAHHINDNSGICFVHKKINLSDATLKIC